MVLLQNLSFLFTSFGSDFIMGIFPFILNWIDKYNTPIQVPLRPTTDIHFKPFDFETHAQKLVRNTELMAIVMVH